MESAERADLFDRVLEIGSILPAIDRVKRSEMEKECFTSDADDVPLWGRFQRHVSEEVMSTLNQIAREWVSRLPREGTTHTLFNCLDVVAGELNRIFLSVKNWYAGIPNGFVFDARKLIRNGARFRSRDLLYRFEAAILEVGQSSYRTVEGARRSIENALSSVLEQGSWTDEEGVDILEECVSGAPDPGCPAGEIVWEGPLSLDLAIEAWREGRRVH